jgi:uncharacterized protein YlxW (UPF0749 family)
VPRTGPASTTTPRHEREQNNVSKATDQRDHLQALQREREGYEKRAAASNDDEVKAAMTDRVAQVDAELKRLGRGGRGGIETTAAR